MIDFFVFFVFGLLHTEELHEKLTADGHSLIENAVYLVAASL